MIHVVICVVYNKVKLDQAKPMIHVPGVSFFSCSFVPLSNSELPGHTGGLVLNHIRHKVWTQLHVGAPVASHVVVVGGREQSQDLRDMKEEFNVLVIF